MESKDKLKKIDIKDRTCYHFHDIMEVDDILMLIGFYYMKIHTKIF